MKVVGEKYKKVDVLVNNAGVAVMDALLSEVVDFTFNTVSYGLCRISTAHLISLRRFFNTLQIMARLFLLAQPWANSIRSVMKNLRRS